MPTVKVTDATFTNDVINAQRPVMVDFWAEWCGPCHAVAPLLEEIADELAGKLTIAKLNVDENPGITKAYDIVSVPAFKIFKNGVVVAEDIGAIPKDALKAWILDVI
ncbi:MAG TPA: thioredoxin [Beijerinckia sp.]|jgi:thioredoxin 1|nr:thioredoxin [Beijerinckia sp.]